MFDAATRTIRQYMPQASPPPAAKAPEPREKRSAAGDTLTLTDRKPRPDGRPRRDLFERLDANGNNRVSRAELGAWQDRKATRQAARAEGAAPSRPAEPAPPPAFGYQLRNPHGVDQLAQDFGVAPQALMDANGWTDPGRQLPAGSKVNIPDSPAARARAATYGGQVSEATPPGELPAQPKPGEPAGVLAGGTGIAGDPNRVHMTQFTHATWNNSPDAPNSSANCGPASLAMGLKAIGLQPPGLGAGDGTEAWIDRSREAMGAMTDGYGNYGDHAYTDIGEVIQGANASGAKTAWVTMATLDAELAAGRPVVSSGNPAAYNGDWPARGIMNSPYDGGHFITITGKAANGNYVINDPLSNVGAVEISPAQMAAYMAYYGDYAAVSLSV